jgi:hypothetical protein
VTEIIKQIKIDTKQKIYGIIKIKIMREQQTKNGHNNNKHIKYIINIVIGQCKNIMVMQQDMQIAQTILNINIR